jgi:hypothetical protein
MLPTKLAVILVPLALLICRNLNGTACTIDGCFGATTGSIMQSALQKEIVKLNNYAGWFPVYPIASAGVAYRF